LIPLVYPTLCRCRRKLSSVGEGVADNKVSVIQNEIPWWQFRYHQWQFLCRSEEVLTFRINLTGNPLIHCGKELVVHILASSNKTVFARLRCILK